MNENQLNPMQELHPQRNATNEPMPPAPSDSHPITIDTPRIATLVKLLNND